MASPESGFSIVKFTSATGTVGHGLNAAPHLIIAKRTDAAYEWATFWHDLGNNKAVVLDKTNAAYTYSNIWGSAMPTSSVFSFNTANIPSGGSGIAYCVAPVEGYSSVGSYVGNGNATPRRFVYLGFRPAFVLIKASSISGKSWIICDYVRDGFNNNNDTLAADVLNTENDVVPSANSIAILSNGFQHLNDNSRLNQSGATYIYYAVAENPFQANGGLAR